MYSIKEKLIILREIHNPAAAGADLSLLRTVAPGEPGLVRFGLSPDKHADDILMALLQSGILREDIVANRRQFFLMKESSTDSVEKSSDTVKDSPAPDAPSESAPEASSEPEAKKKSARNRSTRP